MSAPRVEVAIIGAGFSGIGMAIRLEQAGIRDYVLFERASEIGGTWRDNTYPGAACDVPSHLYSLSFEPSPHWSRTFASANEIQAYLLDTVSKWKLRERLRLQTEIVQARFDEAKGVWTLLTHEDEQIEARVVISGVGGLVDPAEPDIKGIQSFAGQMFHTARWRHDYDLTGKRVAVIGTGASAVQVVPSIAPKVARLSVFQRTPAWVLPKPDRLYSEDTRASFVRHPSWLRIRRTLRYLTSEFFGPFVFLDAPRLSRMAERASLMHLRSQVQDPELRRKLRPSFQLGCKRILISNDYWRSLTRENVELVTDPIAEIKGPGIETRDGTLHPLDAIVLATGFEVGLARAPFSVVGRNGRSLDDAWSQGAVAYKGMTVAGFPNWFILMGPNTGPGHTSVLVYTEAQMGYILQAIRTLQARDLRFVDVRQDVQDRYNAGLQERMKHMVWQTCKSWYLAEDGTNRAIYPGFASEYVLRTRRFRPKEYQLATW